MNDKQKIVYEALLEMVAKVAQNYYGDPNFDVNLWRDDLDTLSYIVEED